jgi:hypothetical protein
VEKVDQTKNSALSVSGGSGEMLFDVALTIYGKQRAILKRRPKEHG